jgi:two-component system, chemotaxis family, sensor kinase Cph1
MEQIKDFFNGLFSYNEWPARWQCGYWSDFHGWLYIISDGIIWIAYFAIPVIILNYFNKKRDRLNYRPGYFLFAAFILLCGLTHYMDIVMFWFPLYRLNALIRFATGIVSIATVFYLIKILPDMSKVRTSLELKNEIDKRLVLENELKEANRNLQAFAYSVSHDLQEPLRKIAIFTSRLSENTRNRDDQENQVLIEKIGNSANRLQGVVKDMLQLSNITTAIDLVPIDPTIIVKSVLEDLELKIQEKNARIDVGILPAILGHSPYLKQLFLNIISNAIKFSEATPIISVTGAMVGGKAMISVKDNGIGIDPDHTANIFEPFYRLVSRSEYEGSGIGLAICKRVMDVHKGKISVESSLGSGTTFNIEFFAAAD